MYSLSIYAGPRALEKIREEGVRPAHFSVVVGASGGPKWFVLYGLVRYLFGDFFAGRSEPLATLGSSAGAWWLGCLGTATPIAALDRLAELYSTEHYSSRPDAREVSGKARVMLREVLGPEGGRELVCNQRIRTHILADRCRAVLDTDNRVALGLGLALAATSNLLSRRLLGLWFERVVFNNHQHPCELARLRDMRTLDVKLTEENVHDALVASGSIPLVLEGVRDIAGGKPGLYFDGGITDYHFDLPFHASDGLVLYPHFYPRVVPGWFDKHLPWRKVDRRYYNNVVLVAPSREFVAALPYGKIPDRDDFRRLPYGERVGYWQRVLGESARLAEDFARLVEHGEGLDRARPFNPSRRH